MNCLVLSVVLTAAALGEGQIVQQDQPGQPAQASQIGQQAQNQAQQGTLAPAALRLDGQWTVIYAEMDGKRVDNQKFTNFSIRDNVVTCKHDGQEKNIRLEFGPRHMVRSTMLSGAAATSAGRETGTEYAHSHHGVYVAGQDYFALSFNKGLDQSSQIEWARSEPKGADLVLVLRRSGAQGASLTGSQGQFARRSGYFEPAMQQQQTKGAIVVFLPRPDAQVWIDNFQTRQQGTERTFETPPLQQAGTYTVKATWTENGNTVTREQPARVEAGRWTTVEFRTGNNRD